MSFYFVYYKSDSKCQTHWLDSTQRPKLMTITWMIVFFVWIFCYTVELRFSKEFIHTHTPDDDDVDHMDLIFIRIKKNINRIEKDTWKEIMLFQEKFSKDGSFKRKRKKWIKFQTAITILIFIIHLGYFFHFFLLNKNRIWNSNQTQSHKPIIEFPIDSKWKRMIKKKSFRNKKKSRKKFLNATNEINSLHEWHSESILFHSLLNICVSNDDIEKKKRIIRTRIKAFSELKNDEMNLEMMPKQMLAEFQTKDSISTE